MYRWGGDGSYGLTTSAESIHLYVFTPDGSGGGSWATQAPANQDVFGSILSGTKGGAAVCDGTAFYLGGYGSVASDTRLMENAFGSNLPLPGLLTYDIGTRDWANLSSVPISSPYGAIEYASTTCISGLQGTVPGGLIVTLGGQTSSPQAATTGMTELVDMSNITIYDQVNKQWYWQKATGNIPIGRVEFCSVGAAAQDGTYNM